MSVTTLVKEKKERQRKQIKKYEEEEKKRNRKFKMEKFSEQVRDVIKRFESRCFNLNSSEKDVANFIVDYKGRRGLSWDNDYFHAVQFDTSEFTNDHGDIPVTRSSKYNRWKKALQDKFGVVITIEKNYESKRRFGNSGYETYPDYIYTGLVAIVYIPKENKK